MPDFSNSPEIRLITTKLTLEGIKKPDFFKQA
jgi:hypothetical protein